MKKFKKNERIDRTILSIIQNALNQKEKYVNAKDNLHKECKKDIQL